MDKQEETVAAAAMDTSFNTSDNYTHYEEAGPIDPTTLPAGWKYRKIFNTTWYASPKVQLVMVAFVCFLCPGMFNALGGLGGGGKTNATLADNMVR